MCGLVLLQERAIGVKDMACIDANGNVTRSGELILLAMMEPADVDATATETGLPLFKVRSAVRELSKAGLLTEAEGLFKITEKGVEKLEDRRARR